MKVLSTCFVAMMLGLPAQGDTVKVVTDIQPVQALVAQVMQGVGSPEQLMPANVSPHNFSLRPSQARSLQNADLVVWIGPELTPSVSESIETLAPGARHLRLLHIDGTTEHDFRATAQLLEVDGHEDDHDAHDDAHDEHTDEDGHDAHDEHEEGKSHDDHDAHDDHAEDNAHSEHDDHDHDGLDPHAWLDPNNARVWLAKIAEELGEIDPANAGIYASNAILAATEIQAASQDISAKLGPVHDRKFVVFHDAYQYFEARFGLVASGALVEGDGRAPSAARMSELRGVLKTAGVSCVFTEPQFNSDLVASLSEGLTLNVQELDPMGVALPDATYAQIITAMADSFYTCLAPS